MAAATVSSSVAQFTQVVDKVGSLATASVEGKRSVCPLGSRVEYVGASHSCSGKAHARIQIGTNSRRQVVASAVASEQAVKSSDAVAQKNEKTKYFFVVANAKFMLDDEEHFQEQLKERIRHFEETGREQDFWLVHEPAFLDNMPDITRRLGRPAVALVSTDEKWMVELLRKDRSCCKQSQLRPEVH
eukprot:TRINITY_DN10310_c0_g2_i2.p1 TRINITY_DN10310_c0_g2~~TRINITY_DN10310_c0_g2_i2.p1  ORF type:complete len:187 (+),score=44.68 TRINITY_DN10310_c0_g2_i2:110-670(+)